MSERKSKKVKGIPIAVIGRLPIYYQYLTQLCERNIERISSKELSNKLHFTDSQIRQDLNSFGSFGTRGFGYHVKDLKKTIEEILGINSKTSMVLVGAGNIGKAIAYYERYEKRGFYIKAIFDQKDELIHTTINGITVLDIESLPYFLKEHKIDIGILAIPPEDAPKVAQILSDGGVKGIWNFSLSHLYLENETIVEHVNITESLLALSYRIKEQSEKQNKE
ncbi:redox-sensing transcriptional repressor Rex [Haloplasma contractile]|uniref:Redox-sensing transcriptional repressor Rex n=1 Tax=Haloplasma contractile SSD-17B TaxID=1033810 RepID=F7PVZ4_9MOLU|nr:redox-sensing transcriptional repressor Rex [Haloplasma contractile]ERJ12682.1 Redox-sensing transcriptional repressor rex protein [Haloplasma contractile SSD-17B]